MADHDPDDLKLVTLARASRARNGAPEGAAVRDDTGRTYSATTVALQALPLSAVQAAVAIAVASGARGVEAAAVVSAADAVDPADVAVVAELGVEQVRFLRADPSGAVVEVVTF
jgi:hypothetical protein